MKSERKLRRLSAKKTHSRRKPIRLVVESLEERVVPDTSYHNLAMGPLVQDWSSIGQISANDEWVGVPSAQGFLGDGVGYGIANASQNGTRVTINTVNPGAFNQDSPNHRFLVGQKVTIEGVNVPGYNGTFTIVNKVNDTSFQYDTTAGLPPVPAGGTAWSTSIRHGASTATSGDYPRDVNANQIDPNTFAPRGVTEFELDNPTVALAGDATAAAPYLMFYLASPNVSNIRVQYTIRDLDSTARDSIQSVALQFREASISNGIPTYGTFASVGGQWRPGTWNDVPAAYVADATDPNSASRTTSVDVILPATMNNRQFFAVRIITANATGVDEYVGIDDIRISAVGQASFSPAYHVSEGAGTATITVNRTNGAGGELSAGYSVGTTGTATPGSDYTVPPNGIITIPDGGTTASFSVPLIDNGNNTYNVTTAASVGTTATLTTATNHLFVVGQPVTVAGVSEAGYNGTFTITAVTANTFSYTTAGSGLPAGSGGTASGVEPPTETVPLTLIANNFPIATVTTNLLTLTTTVTTTTPHGFQVGQQIVTSGVGTFTASISTATSAGTTATITTTAPHLFAVGELVNIAGVSVAGYNGNNLLITAVTANTISYTVASGLAAGTGGTATAVASVDPYNDVVGGFRITSVPTPTTFTFQAQSFRNSPAGVAGPGVGGTVRLASAALIGVGSSNLNIVDNEGEGTVQLSAATYSVGEGKGNVILTVNRTGSTFGGLVVSFSTSNGTAFAPLDYTTGTLTWADGDFAPKTFTVPITDDAIFAESLTETINLTLTNSWNISSATQAGATVTITTSTPHGFVADQQVVIRGASIPGYNGTFTVVSTPTPTTFTYTTAAGLSPFATVSGATAAYDDAVITGANGTVNITDNDGQGTLAFLSPTYAISETRGPVTLTVLRTGSANGPLSVAYSTANGSAIAGSDYSAASGTLTWANGDSAPKTFTVNINNDANFQEGEENFTVTLSNLNGGFGAPSASIGSPNPATVTITEPGQIQFTESTYTVSEGTPQITVTVTRFNGSAGPVTVQYATSNGSATSGVGNDYLSASGVLSWAAGDVAPKTFTIDILEDTTVETTETINLSLSIGAAITSASQAGTTATITTATNHGFVVGQQAIVSGVSVGGYNGTFFITAVTANTFTYETTSGLAAGTGGLAVTTETATFGSPSSAVVNIGDNDGSGILQLSAATYTLAEDATGPITITVNRTGGTAGTVTVVYNVTGGTAMLGQDFSGVFTTAGGQPGNNQLNRTLTFGPGVTSQTFQIRAVDDNVVEGDETVNIVLSNVLGGATLGTPSSAVLTITDAEPGRAVFSSTTYTATEQGGSLTVTVNRVGASTGTLTVPYSTINGTATAGQDFVAVSGTLTWLPGDTAPKTFVVPLIDDFIPESAETFQVSLGQTGLGQGTNVAPVPTIWYNFDAAGDNPLDGYIFDQGPNQFDLRTFQRNGRTPVSGFVLAPELLNGGSFSSYRSPSGATFPGAGEAYFLEGGLSRTHEPFGPLGVVTSVNGDRFSGLQLAPGPRGSTITGSNFMDNRLNSGNNNSGHSSVTYSFWMQLPELVGTDFFTNRYGQQGNRTVLIGRSSDPGGVDAGTGGDFGGQVSVRTILNYQQDPGYNPLDLPGTVKYTFELRANQLTGGFGSGGFVATNTTFKVGEWNHFAVSYTPTGTLIYKNGVLSELVPIGTMDLGKNAIEEIEGWLRLNQVGFNGASIQEQGTFNIDDLGMWTQQLTAADIQRIYTQGIGASVTNTATVTITANTEENGAVSFSAATYSVLEGDTGSSTLTITVTRSGTFGAVGAVSVGFATTGGTATAGVDYNLVPGTLNWANGETGSRTFTISITGDLIDEANETINLALVNPTGGVALASPSTAVVTITDNEGFFVTQFAPTTTGFTADFSRAFTANVLNLYDTQDNLLGPADVTLTGPGGQLRGSLAVNSPTSITFLTTSGTLAPGMYTLRLRSAANGFKDTTDILLDGNNDGTPGDDFVGTFTVAPFAGVTVSVPNVMRGPGQTVNIPATRTGIPLRLSDGTGVTRVDLTLRWNQALLSITGATVGPNVPGGSTVVINPSPPEILSLTFTSQTELGAGGHDFIILTAAVPLSTTSSYTSKHVLNIGAVQINEGAIAGQDDDALHIVGFLGDTSGNGTYSSTDATRILRVAVGLDSGFASYQLADPIIVADVSGNGQVNAIDGTRVMQEAVGIDTSEIPALPSGMPIITPVGPDPFLRFGKSPLGKPGQMITVPLLLDKPEGLDSAEFAISFDASRLKLVRVERGSLTEDFDLFAVNANVTEGTIRVSMGRTEGPLGAGEEGSVLLVTFRVRDDAPAGSAIINLRESVGTTRTHLNEGGLDLNPDPTDEEGDSLDGRIVIRSNAKAVDAIFRQFRRGIADVLAPEVIAALTRKSRSTSIS